MPAISEAEGRSLIVATARSWLKTPYVHAGQVKGSGCDCGTFLIGVYSEAGIIEFFKPKPYTPDFMLHNTDPIYLNHVLERSFEIEEAQALPGDLVMYLVGMQYAHAGIIDEGGWDKIIHAYKEVGWVTQDHGLGGRWGRRKRRFFSYWNPNGESRGGNGDGVAV